MKHPPMDLSRFQNCSIKKAAICDLLLVPAFKRMVDEYIGEIDDRWVACAAKILADKYRTTPEYSAKMRAAGKDRELELQIGTYQFIYKQIRYFRRCGLYDD